MLLSTWNLGIGDWGLGIFFWMLLFLGIGDWELCLSSYSPAPFSIPNPVSHYIYIVCNPISFSIPNPLFQFPIPVLNPHAVISHCTCPLSQSPWDIEKCGLWIEKRRLGIEKGDWGLKSGIGDSFKGKNLTNTHLQISECWLLKLFGGLGIGDWECCFFTYA